MLKMSCGRDNCVRLALVLRVFRCAKFSNLVDMADEFGYRKRKLSQC
jgi:hypothetical protein